MSKIKKWLGAMVIRIRGAADRRLDHALRCPQCEHTAKEASAECKCWDGGCLCVVLHETRYYS